MPIDRRLLCALLFLLLAFAGRVQAEGENYRLPPADTWEELQADDKLNYELKTKRQINPLKDLYQFVNNWFNQLWGLAPSGQALRYLLIFLAVVLLLYALFRLSGMDRAGQEIAVEGRSTDLSAEVLNLEKLDLDAELARAREVQDWALQLRLHYLRALRLLARTERIVAQAGKTNREYAREIKDAHLLHLFGRICQSFERTWYGGFPARAEEVRSCEDDLAALEKQLR